MLWRVGEEVPMMPVFLMNRF
ncbi:UNVERIFIED_CONTAM: hypothetical protein GTU68_048341 [Idotea baltica]|nr:hypothetical protein [Idotea baltica]